MERNEENCRRIRCSYGCRQPNREYRRRKPYQHQRTIQSRPETLCLVARPATESPSRNYWDMNYGKSPALHLCQKAFLVTGEDSMSKVEDISYNTCHERGGTIVAP